MSDKNEQVGAGQKDLATGEITPPLPHDEYTEEFNKRVAAEQKQREATARRQSSRTAARSLGPATGAGAEKKGDDAKK